jgi:hypothetical protein
MVNGADVTERWLDDALSPVDEPDTPFQEAWRMT